MPTNVIMPQLGESVVDGTVSRWLKREGDPIDAFEPIVEISTDKVETEIPAEAGGVLLKIYVPEGQTVERGTVLAVIGQLGEAVPAATSVVDAHHSSSPNGYPAANNAHSAPAPAVPTANPAASTRLGYTGHVTPVVARMAAEHQLDLTQIKGTGRGGRVTKKDVEAYLETAPTQDDTPPWERPVDGDLFKPTVEYGIEDMPASPQKAMRVHPVEPTPQGSEGELIPLSPMRKAIAEHMVFSKRTSPHVTTVFEIDLSAVLKHREANKESAAKQGVNLTLTAYFVMAAVEALRAVPTLNARWTDDGIYLINTINIGMAVALENGLIVPVIQNAGDLNLLGTARAVNDLSTRARAKQLKPDEVQSGTFSITNHGVSGSLFATPIINQPQVGILGIGLMEKRVKVIDDMIAVRPCVYASLTFDHRVVDGASGDAFLLTLKRRLEAWA
jgi:2-oxoglutarate dehydrogenase E2 component (dihydrolipoamide succinyltransferase)